VDATPSEVTRGGWDNPAFQAFWLLRIGFTVASILFGADKFAHVLATWPVPRGPLPPGPPAPAQQRPSSLPPCELESH